MSNIISPSGFTMCPAYHIHRLRARPSTTTTSKYQIHPDFFENKKDCDDFKFRQRHQTNPRYKNFCQTHFTAGDVDQFEKYRDKTNGNNPDPEFESKNNIWCAK